MEQSWNSFDAKFRPKWKDQKSSYQVGPILTIFCDLVCITSGKNCVKDNQGQNAWDKL